MAKANKEKRQQAGRRWAVAAHPPQNPRRIPTINSRAFLASDYGQSAMDRAP
jgi:hypothetical protein